MAYAFYCVVAEVIKLPSMEQDILAALVMDEIKSEQLWNQLLKKSDCVGSHEDYEILLKKHS